MNAAGWKNDGLQVATQWVPLEMPKRGNLSNHWLSISAATFLHFWNALVTPTYSNSRRWLKGKPAQQLPIVHGNKSWFPVHLPTNPFHHITTTTSTALQVPLFLPLRRGGLLPCSTSSSSSLSSWTSSHSSARAVVKLQNCAQSKQTDVQYNSSQHMQLGRSHRHRSIYVYIDIYMCVVCRYRYVKNETYVFCIVVQCLIS